MLPSVLGPVEWQGQEPLTFNLAQRYFVIVIPTCEGWPSLLDCDHLTVEPLWCGNRVLRPNNRNAPNRLSA